MESITEEGLRRELVAERTARLEQLEELRAAKSTIKLLERQRDAARLERDFAQKVCNFCCSLPVTTASGSPRSIQGASSSASSEFLEGSPRFPAYLCIGELSSAMGGCFSGHSWKVDIPAAEPSDSAEQENRTCDIIPCSGTLCPLPGRTRQGAEGPLATHGNPGIHLQFFREGKNQAAVSPWSSMKVETGDGTQVSGAGDTSNSTETLLSSAAPSNGRPAAEESPSISTSIEVFKVPGISRSSLGELRSYKCLPPEAIVHLWASSLLILGYLNKEDVHQSPAGMWRRIQRELYGRNGAAITDKLSGQWLSARDISSPDNLAEARALQAMGSNARRSSVVAVKLDEWVLAVLGHQGLL